MTLLANMLSHSCLSLSGVHALLDLGTDTLIWFSIHWSAMMQGGQHHFQPV